MTDPTTPDRSGFPTVRDDGSVDTGDRPGWVWVRDTQTGHRFDIKSTRLPRYGVEVVEGAAVNYGRFARDAKAFVGKGGEPAAPQQRPAEVTSGDEARAEQITTEQAAPAEQAPDVNEAARPSAAFTVSDGSGAPAETTQISGTAGSTTPDTKTRKGSR